MKRLSVAVLLSSIVIGWIVMSGAALGAAAHPSGNSHAYSSSGAPEWGMMTSSDANGMMSSWLQYSSRARLLTIDRAQHRVQLYMRQYDNPHLVIDEIMEFQRNFYAIVKDTGTGHGAFEVLVNKASSQVFPEYGPAMMWNTKYGMMHGGMMGGNMMGYRYTHRSMTVSAAQAAYIARQWLARNRPGTTTEAPDQFPGYYTVHFRSKGTIAGMLSVNGYTGQVWYHTWHGKFIRMKEVNR